MTNFDKTHEISITLGSSKIAYGREMCRFELIVNTESRQGLLLINFDSGAGTECIDVSTATPTHCSSNYEAFKGFADQQLSGLTFAAIEKASFLHGEIIKNFI